TLAKLKLDAYIVPRADEHQGEYVPPSAERLAWLTGFTGSAGNAVIGLERAALFVDGRYRVQSRAQVDTRVIEIVELPGNLTEWMRGALAAGSVVGFDPWLLTAAQVERTAAALREKGITLKPVSGNLVDKLWAGERPAPPLGPVIPHPDTLAGRSASDKIEALQKFLKSDGHDAIVLTATDSVAWLFNIRGSDVPHTPVVLAFAIVPASGKPELFVAAAKIGEAAKAHLSPIAKLSPPSALAERLDALKALGKKVRVNAASAAYWIERRLGGKARVARGLDPIVGMKAVKNAVEIEGARAAHVRDGAAVTRFLAWLDAEAPKGRVDEIGAVVKLEELRRATDALKEISFDTISGSGPNGAIVHYRVTEATNRKLRKGELYLIDSGGQYDDGTTDITRTVAIGKPTAEMRTRYTLVLKGHIAIATVRFPRGTRGIDLDPFARRPLWEHGIDYDHGTGHGVGSYLSVHEGPQSISRAGMERLEPGMIISNEPGYYKDGAYGIRIENLVLVCPPTKPEGGDRDTMAFETLTLAPFDRRLILKDLLVPQERDWLNAYHARVRATIGPLLDRETRSWLDAATDKL
ncbi:MAG: X-Pro aminopeptidase, partial [Hyphomicrobium sp.]